MKYKLIGKNNYFNPIETIFINRGIDDAKEYIKAGENKAVVNDFNNLRNIDVAVDCLLGHVELNNNIWIQTDPDADGITSSVILIRYLKESFPDVNLTWRHQEGKEHGVRAAHVPKETHLVIAPDSSSSDYKEHEILHNRGIDVLVLDHHITEKESEHAIVVNNQISPKYTNKDLSGAGVVYRFLEALDERLGAQNAKKYLDLVACGIVGDLMNLKSLENRYFISQGAKNIVNPMLKEIVSQLEYITKGKINPKILGWNVNPLINATLRAGTKEEKEQMFDAFLDDGTTKVKYKEKHETLLKNTFRMMQNIRNRQKTIRDEGTALVEKKIEDKNLLQNKVLVVEVGELLDKKLTGLVANNLLEKYKRPVLLLRYDEKSDTLSGSARGSENEKIKSLKDYLDNTGFFEYARGHDFAFGLKVERQNLIDAVNWINEDLKDIEIDESVYEVDFIIPSNTRLSSIIEQIDELEDLWGREIDEPIIAIEKVEVERRRIGVIGKNKNVIKFEYKGIEYIKFRADESEVDTLTNGNPMDMLTFNVIGKCSINEFRGNKTPQIIIEDYEIVETKERKLIF